MLALPNLILQSAIGSCAQEAAASVPTSACAAQTSLAAFIIIAILLDALIVAVWYMLGYILNDQRIKANARGEFVQLIGTTILVAIIVGVLAFFASLYMSSYGSGVMSPQAMYYTCNNIASGSRLTLFAGNIISTTAGPPPLPLSSQSNLLEGSPSFPGICAMVAKPTSFTQQIDYPLAASDVLIANLTNQTLVNLNALFTIDTYLGFLDSFTPFVEPVCWSNLEACLLPGLGTINFDMKISFQPYAGYDLIFNSYGPLGDLLALAFESYVAQFIFLVVMLLVWPYMLFIGVVLRATPFTRKIGGLFIAIAVGAVIFLPVMYAIEYTNLCAGVPYYVQGSAGQPLFTTPVGCAQVNPSSPAARQQSPGAFAFNSFAYGYNGLTTLPANSPLTGNYYDINFFVMPNVTYIGTHTYDSSGSACWPSGGIAQSELFAIGYSLTPGFEAALLSASPSGVLSSFNINISCSQQSALSLLYNLFQAYGVVGVSAYFMPLINMLVVISAVIGLSGMLGGDTELAGLAKLV